MKKDVLIEMTSKYLSITSYLIGRLRFVNPDQEITYLNLDTSDSDLGKEIRNKLAESKEVTEGAFMSYWKNKERLVSFNKGEIIKIIEQYNYKGKNDIYKDTLFLNVTIFDDILSIIPLHQDGIGTYGTVRNEKGIGIEFKYSSNISDIELGQKVIEAFEYCTSIYKNEQYK